MYIYIRSMSEAQKVVYDDIRNVGYKIVEHLIKLVLFPEAQERHHWEKEIIAMLHSVSKVKSNNKYPKYKFILDALQTRNDTIDALILYVKDEESDLTSRDISSSVIENAIVKYQEWLARELSMNGVIIPQAAYAQLEEIVDATL